MALRNVRHLCPSIATILINTYRASSELLVDNQVLWSQEGTTQGDPLAMPFYALATLRLINSLPTSLHHIWYADDASACGKISDIYSWWSTLVKKGFLYGYFPNSSKTYLVVKKDHLGTAKDVFCDSNIQITTSGRPLLGAAIGSEEFIESLLKRRLLLGYLNYPLLHLLLSLSLMQHTVNLLMGLFINLISFAVFNVIFVTCYNLLRISLLSLITVLTGRPPLGSIERGLVALPVRLGGLGLLKITEIANIEYNASREISQPLSDIIVSKKGSTGPESDPISEQFEAKAFVVRKKKSHLDHSSTLRDQLPPSLQLAMDLAMALFSSSGGFWFYFTKGGFRDALSLRYGWIPPNLPSTCECGSPFSIEHSLSCPKEGFTIIRHNEVRDIFASWLSEVCTEVRVEPPLQPITSETMSGASAIVGSDARLDIVASGPWGGQFECTYFDVRVFNPYAPSNRFDNVMAAYQKHETLKKRAY